MLLADAAESLFCAFLSATVLVGLVLNVIFGWWWADSVAALAIVPLGSLGSNERGSGQRATAPRLEQQPAPLHEWPLPAFHRGCVARTGPDVRFQRAAALVKLG